MDPMDYNLSASSDHEIFQARILEWIAISFSRGSSQPRDWTQVSCIAGKCRHLSPQGSPVISQATAPCAEHAFFTFTTQEKNPMRQVHYCLLFPGEKTDLKMLISPLVFSTWIWSQEQSL